MQISNIWDVECNISCLINSIHECLKCLCNVLADVGKVYEEVLDC